MITKIKENFIGRLNKIFLILLIGLMFAECSNEKYIIENTELDKRFLEKYFIHPIVRNDLELLNITETDYDFQLMNSDEWGMYFDLIRVDFEKGKVEVAIQDSIRPIPRKYEFKQYLYKMDFVNSIDSLIDTYGIWDIKDTLNKNRITDGGDLSIIIIDDVKSKLITWQDFDKNESFDKLKVRKFYYEIWILTRGVIEEEYLIEMKGGKRPK